jgi:proline dehydrogenase
MDIRASQAFGSRQVLPTSDDTLRQATAALKALAADHRCRAAFARSPLLAELLAGPASRYIVGADRAALFQRLWELGAAGYRLGVEYVGEEVKDVAEVRRVVDEYLALISNIDCAEAAEPVQLGFDLSAVGLLVSPDLAYENTSLLLRAAAEKDLTILLSMERSAYTDAILDVFSRLAAKHENVAVTLQAHLHRTPADVPRIAALDRKVRLVKGVYGEAPQVAIPRSQELDDRYCGLLESLLAADVPVACATHDAALLEQIDGGGWLEAVTEVEMLHGVQPALLRSYHERGVPCRIATVYGQDWWLHFLHRLAEHPQNVLVALADYADPSKLRDAQNY